jgi:hypothetical protein
MNSNKNIDIDKKKVFYIALAIIILSSIFIFLMIRFKKKGSEIQYGYQYFPKDITTNNKQTKKYKEVEECIKDCKDDGYCGGLTFDTTSNICYKFNKGEIVPGETKHIAWEKEKEDKDFFDKTLLTGKVSNEKVILKETLFTQVDNNKYAFSFWLDIKDFYGEHSNHKVWKHILNKGNNPDIQETDNWKDIENIVINQSPGIWLAPYTNNIRICFAVNFNKPNISETQNTLGKLDINSIEEEFKYRTLPDNIQENKNTIQYIDIIDVPINKLFFMCININGNVVEIYLNNNLHKTMILYGSIIPENNNIYIKSKPTFNGNLYNLNYLPYFIKYQDVKDLYKKKPF